MKSRAFFLLHLFNLSIALTLIPSCSGNESWSQSNKKFDWEQSAYLTKQEKQLAYAIDTFFQHKVKHTGLNGCVLVADKGKVLYQKCFGYEDYRGKKMLTDSSAFQLASVTKPFTATAILMLSEEGKLKLDDPVSKYIRHFPYDSITIRMLLNHRSGLANYIYLFDTMKLPADTFITNQQVVNYFVENSPALHSVPGHRFEYCNSNYALLAFIIEKVSGDTYSEFMTKNIFEPAHMNHTYVSDASTKEHHECQTCDYKGSQWQAVEAVPYDGVIGDKGIYSTTYDLYLFDQALNHGMLLKKETLDEAYKGYSYEKPGIRNYGLGWRLKEFPDGEKLVYHNGWWRGYNTIFDRRPDRGTCVIVLSNKYNRNAYDLRTLFEMLHMMDGEADEEGNE